MTPFARSLLLVTCIVSSTSAAPSLSGTLQWRNGDSINGTLAGADAQHIYWQTDIFSQPFAIETRYLQSVRLLGTGPRTATSQPLRFVTRMGDVLYGKLKQIDKTHVVVESDQMSEVKLLRAAVKSFRQLTNPAAMYEGPEGLEGWTTLNRGRRTSYWNVQDDGGLSTRVVGAELFRDLHLPTVAEIEISFDWRKNAGFMLAFLPPDAQRLPRELVKVETWDNDLVLQDLNAGGEFVRLMTLTPETKGIQLRLLWNQTTGELSVFTPQGDLLGSMKSGTESRVGHTAIYLKNKSSDLTFSRIRVSNWNGATATDLAEGMSRIRLRNGDDLQGIVESYDADSGKLRLNVGGESKEHAFNEIDSVEFGGNDTPVAPDPTLARVVFSTGSLMLGRIQNIENGKMSLQTLCSDQPFEVDLESTQGFGWSVVPQAAAPAVQDENQTAVLNYRGTKLHGELAPVGEDGLLGWRPVGSRNASPLLPDHPALITRKPARGKQQAPLAAGDVVYLTSGEVLPCKVGRVDDTHVWLAATYSNAVSIPREQILAIELRSGEPVTGVAFSSENWRTDPQQKESIVESENQFEFVGPATITHPDLMRCEEIEFTAEWTTAMPMVMTVSLFVERNQSGRGDYFFYFFGEQIIVQEMDGQQGVRHVSREQIARDRVAVVRWTYRNNGLRLSINDRQVLERQFNTGERDGPGITMTISPAGNVQGMGRRAEPQKLLTLRNLRVGSARHPLVAMLLDDERKQQLLTVPRGTEKTPPTHMLVATNGDLLRGRLVTVDDRAVTFKSRLDAVPLPRERIDAIISLQPVGTDSTAGPSTDDRLPIEAVLMNGIKTGFTAGRMIDGNIVGQHPILGECRLPVSDVLELRIGGIAEPTQTFSGYRDWVLLPAKQPAFATADSAGSSDGQFAAASALIGTVPRQFAGTFLDGSDFRLSNYAGKVVVLDFWASWCGPCVRSMPELIDAVSQFPEDQVALIGVNQQEPQAVINDFLKARQWSLQVITDQDGSIARQFEVEAIPHTVVIGRDGVIRYVQVGTGEKLLEEIKAAAGS